MRKQFTLFQGHIDLAHSYWERLLEQDDLAIDATCGNGHDTVFLARRARVIAMDVQEKAVESTRGRLEEVGVNNVQLIHGCHSSFPPELTEGSVKLVVYNLGYLPGGDKTQTTQTATTLTSVEAAMKLIAPGGAISLTLYPGHEEGAREAKSLLTFLQALSPREWSLCQHRWGNRNHSPELVLLQRSIT